MAGRCCLDLPGSGCVPNVWWDVAAWIYLGLGAYQMFGGTLLLGFTWVWVRTKCMVGRCCLDLPGSGCVPNVWWDVAAWIYLGLGADQMFGGTLLLGFTWVWVRTKCLVGRCCLDLPGSGCGPNVNTLSIKRRKYLDYLGDCYFIKDLASCYYFCRWDETVSLSCGLRLACCSAPNDI
jgi:hypothetical protein